MLLKKSIFEVGKSCERDSSGTTEARNEMKREGDGADSPTRANNAHQVAPLVRQCASERSGSPKSQFKK